ncbi:MAG: CoA-acylating methylmalonate-semialdehyde dehydrogenase [Pseudomonadota bacterium]
MNAIDNSNAVSKIGFWINNQHVLLDGMRHGEITNPASGKVIRHVTFANQDSVHNAVQAAQAAFPAWRATPPLRRARIMMEFLHLLRKHEKELAALASEEHGKTLPDALGSVRRGIEVVEFACGIPHLIKGEHSRNVGTDVDCHSVRDALGVCVGITPFNFPVMVPMWMFPMSIACGNTFVLKPSEKVPSCSMRIAELLKEAGLPDGVFNVIHGDKETVDALVTHPQVKAVSFVGSTPIAQYIYETGTKHGKRVQALGGAKNHAVVMPDADLDLTVDALVGAAYGSAGERCMAISVVVAVGKIADALVDKIKEKAENIQIGPGDRSGVEMGPLVSRVHRDKVSSFIDQGEADGAQLILDGRNKVVSGYENGFYLGVSLFDHVTSAMRLYREEIFGPVLSIVRVDTLDQAVALINACPYANGTALFTESGGAARKFESEIEVGMVGINVPIPVPMAFFSFGGWKASLFGDHSVHGMDGVRFYTRPKVITTRWTSSEPGLALNMPTLG